MRADLSVLKEAPQALVLANDGRSDLWAVEAEYHEDLLAALERIREQSDVLSCYSLGKLLELIAGKNAALILGESADETGMSLVGIAAKVSHNGKNIAHLDLEARTPIGATVAESIAAGLEWLARMDTGPGLCGVVQIAATGPFPVPAGYELKRITERGRSMQRRLHAMEMH